MIKGSSVRLRVYKSTIAAAAAAAAVVSTNVGLAATSFAVPTLPNVTSATGGNHSSTVTWTPRAGGTAYYNIDYLVWPFTGTIIHDYNTPANGTSETTTGLTNGQLYEVIVEETIGSTVYDSQNGVFVTPNPPATLPGAPTGVAGTADDSAVDLSWTAAAANNSAITGYTIAFTDTTDGSGSGTRTTSGTGTSATVSGLVPGDHYRFTVTATNGIGTGPTSSASASVVPYTLPGAPTAVTAVAANAAADVSWTPPASDGFNTISDYTIYYTDSTDSANSGSFDTGDTATSATVTGLVNGDVYTFALTASNDAGEGLLGDASTDTTIGATPDAPKYVTATAGLDQATVEWGGSTADGGFPITGFTVYYVDTTDISPTNNGSVAAGAGTTSKAVTGLIPGDSYSFTVTATNSRGDSGHSDPASATPYDVPAAPAGVTATAGPAGSQATVDWTAADPRGSAVLGYRIEATDTTDPTGDKTQAAAAADRSGIVTGLVPGDSYTFQVVAINSIGNGDASSSSAAVSPFTTPGAPDAPAATGGNGSADLTWAAPADDGGSPVTGYLITYTDALNPGDSGTYSNPGTGVSGTVPGLIGGETYTFTVTAINAAGNGTASPASSPLAVQSAPDAPTGVTATAGPAGSEATIAWTAPVNTGGSPILGYSMTLDDGVDPVLTVVAGSGASSVIADGLVPGASYTVMIVAVNAIGSSPAVGAADPVTAFTTPDAPTAVSGDRGDGSVDLTWTAPAGDGGSAVTGYVITYVDTTNPAGNGTSSPVGTGTTASVTGLVNGDSYTFTVAALNAAGPGAASAPSSAVTPATTPGAPTGVAATADSSSADITWTAPASAGGSPVTSYLISYVDSSPGGVGGIYPSAGAGTSATVPGLVPGDVYTFTVGAVNDVGPGGSSDPSNQVSPYTIPGAATGAVATAAPSSAGLSWTAPASDGGSPITGYTITYTDTSNPAGNGVYNPAGTGISATVPDLVPGDSYTFTVTAVNAAGNAPASDPSNAISPFATPAAPTGVSGTRSNHSVALTWTAPTITGGSAITGYVVVYTDVTNPAGDGSYASPAGTATATTVPGLVNGDSYTFTVAAINGAGTGTFSDPSGSVTPATTPGLPTALHATPGSTSANLTWTGPFNGGSPITGYLISYVDTSDQSGDSDGTTNTVGAGASATVTGLVAGDVYNFTVTAINTVGTGLTSHLSNNITPYTAASAPGAVTATAGLDQISVDWTTPADDGGRAITGYVVTLTDGVNPPVVVNVPADTTSTVVTGLTAGNSYAVSVVAANLSGYGAPGNAPTTTTPFTFADVPTTVAAAAGQEQATVTWGAPASDGFSPVSGYVVSWTDLTTPAGSGSEQVGTNPRSDTLTLTEGEDYTFSVAAINAAGTGDGSDPTSAVTPYDTPGTPTAVVATPRNTSADLTWTAPSSDGYSPITGYTIAWIDQTNPLGSGTVESPGSGVSGTVLGLVNGDSYTFTVTAENIAGSGDASDASTAVSPLTIPDAPAGVTATADADSADLSWTAPADGGSVITGYTISYTDTTDPAGNGIFNPTGTGNSATVPNLIPGDSYTFTVTATNLAGDSAASDPSSAVSPYTTPDAVGFIGGTRGNSSVDLTWTAPADGGSPITGYTIDWTDTTNALGSGTTTTTGPGTTDTITGLTNGDSYTFVITATNTAGNGTPSDPSGQVTPATTPGTATGVTAAAGSALVHLTWTDPASDGGSPITGYTIGYHDLTNSNTGTFPIAGPTTSTTFGLPAGDSYTFTVTARNDVGAGPASAASNAVTPYTTPGVPTSVSAVAGDASAEVSWTAPADGGSPITGYTISYVDTDNAAGNGTSPASGSGTSTTVTGLLPGDHYTFTVTATNAAGDGGASDPSSSVAPYTTPDAVGFIGGTRENSSVDLTWTAPADGGSPITGYTIDWTDTTDAAGDGTTTTAGPGTTDTITGLTNGDIYTFVITATNTAGNGTPSDPSGQVTPATTPGTATGVAATAGDSQATVTWTAAYDGGSPITGYTITYTDTDNALGDGSVLSAGDGTSATVASLIPGDHYTFTVTATNDVGSGSASASSTAVKVFTSPDAPTGVTAVVGQHGAPVVSWTAPAFDGGSPIIRYRISYTDTTRPGSGVVDVGPSTRSVAITGLVGGDSYTFTVTAYNAETPGTISPTAGPVTAYNAPGTPTAVVATAGSSRATVTWVAPTSSGGSPITTYTVRYVDRTNPAHSDTHVVDPGERSDGVALVPGDSYTVTVTATNAYDTGAPSTPSGAVTPYTVAGAPTGVVATPGDGTAAVRWTAPASNGHSAITAYIVTVTDRTAHTARTVRIGSTPGASVTGLVDGHSYSFSVVTVNAAGSSAPSATSAAVTPVLPLIVRAATLVPAIGVGLSPTLADFALTLNRPGAVTVTLVKGATVVSTTAVSAGGTAITGSVRINVTTVALLGDYSWVVRDAAGGRVLLTRGVVLKQNSFLAIVATRSGGTISVLGVAKWASLDAGKVLPLTGKTVRVQRFTADGWVTIRTLATDRNGHVNLTLAIAQRVGLRLVDAGTGQVVGVISNTATL